MIWLIWRQHRRQALSVLVGLAVLVTFLVLTGRPMYRDFADTGLRGCLDAMGAIVDYDQPDADCNGPAERFNAEYSGFLGVAVLLVFLPLLVGLFVGAPLVAREVQHGTHRLVWTQGVTRRRWAVAKFTLIIAGAGLLAGAYALVMSWWVTPLVLANAARFEYLAFDLEGMVPVAHTLFAVALGILAGTVSRRVLPAMAVTLVGYAGVRLAVAFVRPHFRATRRAAIPRRGGNVPQPDAQRLDPRTERL